MNSRLSLTDVYILYVRITLQVLLGAIQITCCIIGVSTSNAWDHNLTLKNDDGGVQNFV